MMMSGDFRHHRANREGPIVVIVPVPVGGSPEPQRSAKPLPYPRQGREPWRPQTKPPNRKAEVWRRFLDGIRRQDEAARAMHRPNAALSRSAP